ncbi:phage tail tape measure protein [Acidaminococcus sp.]|uniref:phage tail tape measure protein n=1 Tax=Acidaminococcus sp. TaxID=1872103 RepID=UPI003D7EF1C8
MAGRIMELAIAIKGKIDGSLSASTKDTAQSIGALKDKLKQLNNVGSMANTWVTAAKAVRDYKNELGQAQQAVRQASAALDTSGDKAAKVQNNYTAAKNRVQQMGVALHQSRLLLAGVSSELESAGFSTKNFAQSQAELKNQIEAANKALDAQQKKAAAQQKVKMAKAEQNGAKHDLMTSFANFQGGMATAQSFAAPLVSSVQVAANFEQAMSKVQAITNADNADMQKLSATARDLGASTKFSATQSAQAMSYLGMAGWKTDQIISGMPGLLDLAAASGTDLALTADIVSDDLTAFGMSADQAGKMADVFAATATNSNTNTQLLGDTFKYAGAVAGALGYKLEDVAVATGMMANAGIKGEQAGTALRSIMTRMVAPTKESGTAMDALGISVTNADGSVKPLAQTIAELRQKFAGLSDSEKAQYASMIAGKEGMSGFLALVNGSDADFEKLVKAIQNSDGAAKRMAKTMNANARGALVQLQSATESVQISVGNVFLPILARAATALAGVAARFAGWAAKNPQLVATLAAVAGVVAAVVMGLLGFSVVVSMFSYVSSSIKLFQAAMQSAQIATKLMTVAQAALNFVMSLNPVALVVIGVLALIAALMVLYNKSETVRNFIDWAAKSIAEAFNAAWAAICEGIASAASWIISQWKYIYDTACDAWNAIVSAVEGVWDTIYGIIDNGVKYVQDKWEQLKAIFSSPITAAVNFITTGSTTGAPEKHAYGGLISRPTLSWVGEAGDPEMIVPINRTQNAMRLWQSAGQMLGVRALQPVKDPAPLLNRGQSVTVNFAPTVQVTGGAATADQIRQVLWEQKSQFEASFRRMYQDMVQRERRLSFE